MNRLEIKERAKEIVKENFKDFWIGYFIVLALSILCSLGVEVLVRDYTVLYSVLTILVSFFTMTLSVGFYCYVLKMIRKEENREDIFKYVGDVLPIATISILVLLFTLLFGILFIVPGIIAALSFSMVFLIYVDQDGLLPMEYLFKSKEMMRGHKWDYFVFVLSFVGWILFSILTLGLGLIFVIPYVTISEVLYYEELKNIQVDK